MIKMFNIEQRSTTHLVPACRQALDKQPSVLIIVLCHNGVALTLACLNSLRRLTYKRVDLLVIDNASQDGTPALVRHTFPEVRVIETGANLGFAAGNNVGLGYALQHGYDYALLLNNDTEVAPDLLDALITAAEEDPAIGVVGPKIYYHDRPTVIWSAGGIITWGRGLSHMRGIDTVDQGQFDEPADVDFVTGCALLVRSAVMQQVGMLDERFGMYYEETEWCVRIARAGWRIQYVPSGRLWHKIRPAQQDQSPRITYYMARNRLLFLRLTRAPLIAWLHALILQDLRTWCAWRIRSRWRGRATQRVALRHAWRDFMLNRFGMVRWEA
jgi:GT2 family glycosyltransferase